MAKRRVLKKGDYLGPYNVVYVQEAYKKNNKRYVECVCGNCNKNHFIARLDCVDAGKVFRCKECSSIRKAEQWKEYQLKGQKKAAENNKKYFPGDILPNNILFIQELEPVIDTTGHKRRVGIFQNLETNIIYTTWLKNVTTNNTLGLSNFSSGEYKIMLLLKRNNIKYKYQYSFEECKNPKTGYKLRFDFYLPKYNVCIEYDGEQHFSNTFGLSEEEYLNYLQNSKIKDNFCKEQNIKIIHIPYWDYDKISIEYIKNRIIL